MSFANRMGCSSFLTSESENTIIARLQNLLMARLHYVRLKIYFSGKGFYKTAIIQDGNSTENGPMSDKRW